MTSCLLRYFSSGSLSAMSQAPPRASKRHWPAHRVILLVQRTDTEARESWKKRLEYSRNSEWTSTNGPVEASWLWCSLISTLCSGPPVEAAPVLAKDV